MATTVVTMCIPVQTATRVWEMVVVPTMHRHVVIPHAATLVVNAVMMSAAAVNPAASAAMTLREAAARMDLVA